METIEQLEVTLQERPSDDFVVIGMRVYPFRRGFALVDEHPLVEFKIGHIVSSDTLAKTLDTEHVDVVVEPCEYLH